MNRAAFVSTDALRRDAHLERHLTASVGTMSGGAPLITPPANLRSSHDVTAFDSGVPVLDDWLKKRALAIEVSGASRTYVVCEAERVIGYYAIGTGAVTHEHAPGKVRRNMPEPVPVMVLGRLAVDNGH